MSHEDAVALYCSLDKPQKEFFDKYITTMNYKVNRPKYIDHEYNFIMTLSKYKMKNIIFVLSEIKRLKPTCENFDLFYRTEYYRYMSN